MLSAPRRPPGLGRGGTERRPGHRPTCWTVARGGSRLLRPWSPAAGADEGDRASFAYRCGSWLPVLHLAVHRADQASAARWCRPERSTIRRTDQGPRRSRCRPLASPAPVGPEAGAARLHDPGSVGRDGCRRLRRRRRRCRGLAGATAGRIGRARPPDRDRAPDPRCPPTGPADASPVIGAEAPEVQLASSSRLDAQRNLVGRSTSASAARLAAAGRGGPRVARRVGAGQLSHGLDDGHRAVWSWPGTVADDAASLAAGLGQLCPSRRPDLRSSGCTGQSPAAGLSPFCATGTAWDGPSVA